MERSSVNSLTVLSVAVAAAICPPAEPPDEIIFSGSILNIRWFFLKNGAQFLHL